MQQKYFLDADEGTDDDDEQNGNQPVDGDVDAEKGSESLLFWFSYNTIILFVSFSCKNNWRTGFFSCCLIMLSCTPNPNQFKEK